jgi:hypothetical protein
VPTAITKNTKNTKNTKKITKAGRIRFPACRLA